MDLWFYGLLVETRNKKGEIDVSRSVRWMTSGGRGPVGAGHRNGAPQIRSAALGMTKGEDRGKERPVAG